MRVAQALHTSVSALLGERVGDDILHVVRAADRQLRPAAQGKYEFAPLSRADGNESPTTFLLRLSADSIVREQAFHAGERSEARRVGKECVRRCQYWWSP